MNFKLFSFFLITTIFFFISCKKEVVIDSIKLTYSDGNVYNIVRIGDQSWIDQNYRGLKYRNGDPIPLIENGNQWSNLASGAICYFNNNKSNESVYSGIYNFYSINDNRIIAPKSWHVATKEDWEILSYYLGGEVITGAKLKTTVTGLWALPNKGANNESLFSAVLGGFRNINGDYESERFSTNYWTSTEDSPERAWYYIIYSNDTHLEA